MGLLEILTIIFVILKLCGTIDWSWWLVLLPEIVSIGVAGLWFLFVGGTVIKAFRKFK